MFNLGYPNRNFTGNPVWCIWTSVKKRRVFRVFDIQSKFHVWHSLSRPIFWTVNGLFCQGPYKSTFYDVIVMSPSPIVINLVNQSIHATSLTSRTRATWAAGQAVIIVRLGIFPRVIFQNNIEREENQLKRLGSLPGLCPGKFLLIIFN